MTDLADLAGPAALGPGRHELGRLPPVHAVYQPIVNLRTGETVGYEALARGPRGTGWESPAALFADARRHGVEAALDWECRAAAMSGALRRGLPSSIPLFVNAEPSGLGVPAPGHLVGIVEQATDRLQLVVEITEGALAREASGLLAAVEELRRQGWGIAIDDVGADPAALALLPLVDPDVIKLDLGLLRERPDRESAAIADVVLGQAQRSGAIILAERIESDEHRDRALSLGAVLGQGWQLGRPGPLPAEPSPVRHELSFTRAAGPARRLS